MEKSLEQRITELEKRVAALEGRVQEQPVEVTVKLENIDDLEKLINEIKDKLNQLEPQIININELRIKHGLTPILGGDVDLIPIK